MAEPLPVAWLDGRFLPIGEARISPLDRGFLFADAAYEVVPVYGGRAFLFREHFARLERSLAAIRIKTPHSFPEWANIVTGLIERNGGGDQAIYIQVSRGAESGRNHQIPVGLRPTVFGFSQPLAPSSADVIAQGVAAVTVPENRWRRCDVKSTMLLGNVLARTAATDVGATEALYLANGELTEGSSSAAIVVLDGVIHAPPETQAILPSTTRALCLELASGAGLPVNVCRIPEAWLRAAAEVWLCFATRGTIAVTSLDGKPVGNGRPGPLWQRVFELFEARKRELAGTPIL
jgi:D-alanine transaminase